MSLLLDKGDTLLAEEFTYPHVVESFARPRGYKVRLHTCCIKCFSRTSHGLMLCAPSHPILSRDKSRSCSQTPPEHRPQPLWEGELLL